MPDPENNGVPPASPAAAAAQEPPAASPGGVPPASVPFNQDPALQDYIARQVENRLQDILQRFGPPPAKPEEGDPLDTIANELAQEENIKPEVAKSFVKKFEKIVKHVTKGQQEKLDQYELTQKFSQVFNKYEDAEVVAPAMRQVYQTLTELEKNFVLKAPDGADYLYRKARDQQGRGALPPSVRAAAGSPPSRGAAPDSKTGSKAALFSRANDCMAKGDRAGYEEAMRQIQRG